MHSKHSKHSVASRRRARRTKRVVNSRAQRRALRSAWGIEALCASLGDADDAFAWLEIAIAEKASGLLQLRVHPRLDPIRNDPRYWPMVKRVGLGDDVAPPA